MSSSPHAPPRTLRRDEVMARLRRELPRLREHGVVGMGVFGATARDELGPDDFIEVTVDIDRKLKPDFTLWDQGAIHADLSEAFGRFVSVVIDGKGMYPELGERIARERLDV